MTVTTNAGKAEIKGAELELTPWPTDSLELSGWYRTLTRVYGVHRPGRS